VTAPATLAALPTLERTLPNGLKVILRESHDAPVASLWVWYRVGSRNELPGLTGISHWVEHMQFKGTPSLPKGAIFDRISRQGGINNALTSNDWTTYFETLPADRLDLALSIEADRMANSLFDPEETEAERTVIISERQGAENSPSYLLYEDVVGTAFRAHPYRHMVIGYEEDLRKISRDDLFGHYRRYYLPNNAYVVAAGDFAAEELVGRIERAFGTIPAGPEPPPLRAVEPPQLGERRVTLRKPAPTAYLRIGFHGPAAKEPDVPALLVADAVLSGGKQMGFGGGGPMGRSARLYRSLVAAGLARGAGSDFSLTVDPYLLMIAVTALPGVEPARIEEVVEREIARLREETVPEEELARALKQVKAQFVYSAEGVTNQAYWLGQMEIVDTWRRADTLAEELEAVTPDDVRRVARTYLQETQRTVGWLLPESESGGAEEDAAPDAAALPRRWWAFSDGQASIPAAAVARTAAERAPFERLELANGVAVLGQARPDSPAVSVRLRLQAGAANDPPGKDGLAAFTGRMLSRGTATRTFDEFNEEADRLGATVGVEVGRHFVEVAVRCLREVLPAALDLAADILRNPTFPEDHIEKVRNELLAAIREQDNDTRSAADRACRRLLFPDGHPLARRLTGETATISALTRDDLVAFHAERFGPRVMTAAVVGGVERVAEAAELLAARFGDWTSTAELPPPVPTVEPPAAIKREALVVPGKTQSDLVAGFPTLARTHPDYYALDMANMILGRFGLMGRLGANVRDKQGLAYYAYSQIESGRELSVWASRAGINPANVERALASIVAEVQRLRDEPVSEDELSGAKEYMTGVLPLALEQSDGVAATLLSIEYYDLGLDFLERYPAIVEALTADQVLTAARTHLDPDRIAVGIAGPPLDSTTSNGAVDARSPTPGDR
jgi:zinc protease